MKNYFNFSCLCILALILTACGTGRTMVLEPLHPMPSTTGVSIQEENDTVKVSQEISNKFSNYLSNKLYEKGRVQKGGDLILKYRFLQMNEGSRLARWFTAGIGNAGEGTLTVEATYYDKSGKLLGKIHTEGKIGSGFFGGSVDNALQKSAIEIANYTHHIIR